MTRQGNTSRDESSVAAYNPARHFAVDPEHPLRTWRVGETRCLTFGVGRLWVHAVMPPRERPNPDGYVPSANAELRIEWRRAGRLAQHGK